MQKMNNRKQNNHSVITDRECEEIGIHPNFIYAEVTENDDHKTN